MATILFPVILAGGEGTRLWPLSRKQFPKQFLRLQSEFSLLQQTMQRLQPMSCEKTIIVSSESHYFLCQEQLQNFQNSPTYLLEPCVRNTAPAIAATAHYLTKFAGSDAMMLILPADHWIDNANHWQRYMEAGVDFASQNEAIVTFGIKPDKPSSSYGYIAAGRNITTDIFSVANFKEKPTEVLAKTFIKEKTYFWNSGMFACRAQVYLDELLVHAPIIYENTKKAVENALYQSDFVKLNFNDFSNCPSDSIDYAIMEKTPKAVLMPVNMRWSDLGCWKSVSEANPIDKEGNTFHGKVIAQHSSNCFISSEEQLITTIGIKDLIVIATNDAILIADKTYSQEVKQLVNQLKAEANYKDLVNEHQRVMRPWGYYEVLIESLAFKVKRLMVKPGAKLSLQSHSLRAEHWVVVAGRAEVIIDDKILTLCVNESTYIPQKSRHRLSNSGTEPLYVIEVQTGIYLKEDDIIRYDDSYARATEKIIEGIYSS